MGAAVGAGKMGMLYKSSLPIKKDFEEISLNRDPLYQTSACCTNFLLHLDTGFKRFRQYQKNPSPFQTVTRRGRASGSASSSPPTGKGLGWLSGIRPVVPKRGWNFKLRKMAKSTEGEQNGLKRLLPVFLCQLHHHGRKFP